MQAKWLCFKNTSQELFRETSALTTKNFLIFSRNRFITILLLLCPIFICFYLQEIQVIVDDYALTFENMNPTEIVLSKIPKCSGPDCITIGIGMTSGNAD